MTSAISRFFIFIFLLGLFFLQASVHQFLFSLTPLMIVIPVVATWGSDRPWLWVVPWVVVAELFTASPPGLITLVALVPPAVHWLVKDMTTDLSFSFFSVLVGTIVLQLLVIICAQTFFTGVVAVPWFVYGEILLSCTTLSFVVCSIWMQVKPLYD